MPPCCPPPPPAPLPPPTPDPAPPTPPPSPTPRAGLSHVYPTTPSGDIDRSRPLKDVCGSKSYAAPEVMAPNGYDGYAADLWSLGVCLFAMLCGYLPFEHPDTPQLYKLILAGSYVASPQLCMLSHWPSPQLCVHAATRWPTTSRPTAPR